MKQLFSNNTSSVLSAAITPITPFIPVDDITGFNEPQSNQYQLATLSNGTDIEIVKITAHAASTLTVARAQEGTAGIAFSAGTKIEVRLTKGTLEYFYQRNDVSLNLNVRSSGVALVAGEEPAFSSVSIPILSDMIVTDIFFVSIYSSSISSQPVISIPGLIASQPTVNAATTRFSLPHPKAASGITVFLDTPAVGAGLDGFFVVNGFYL